MVNRDGCQDEVTGKLYRHINSKFLRLIKCVLEEVGESDGPTSEDTWYSDSKSWNEKFVWLNLYNISPRNGGNPDNKMIKPCMEQYVDMFKAQLDEYKPDIVIACPLSGYFIPWVREKSFDEILIDYKDLSGENGPVISDAKQRAVDMVFGCVIKTSREEVDGGEAAVSCLYEHSNKGYVDEFDVLSRETEFGSHIVKIR